MRGAGRIGEKREAGRVAGAATPGAVREGGACAEEEEACASGEAGKRQSAAGGETERELRDPSSPLHRALSAVPASLPPIRIRAPAGPPPPAPSNLQATPAQALQQAALRMSASETHLLRLSPVGSALLRPRFERTGLTECTLPSSPPLLRSRPSARQVSMICLAGCLSARPCRL